jgi:hypothetical protein
VKALALPVDLALPVAWVDLAGDGEIGRLIGGDFQPVAAASDWVLYAADDHAADLPVNVRAALLLAGLGWPVPGDTEDVPPLVRWLRVMDSLPRGSAVMLGMRWESLRGVEVSLPDWVTGHLPGDWLQPVADGNGGGE